MMSSDLDRLISLGEELARLYNSMLFQNACAIPAHTVHA